MKTKRKGEKKKRREAKNRFYRNRTRDLTHARPLRCYYAKRIHSEIFDNILLKAFYLEFPASASYRKLIQHY